jgi:hypothetical protein
MVQTLHSIQGSKEIFSTSTSYENEAMNKNKNRKNQPPTGEGKHQSPHHGEPRKLDKRSEVLQAQRYHPELNLGDAGAEAARVEGDRPNPKRPKAGR